MLTDSWSAPDYALNTSAGPVNSGGGRGQWTTKDYWSTYS